MSLKYKLSAKILYQNSSNILEDEALIKSASKER